MPARGWVSADQHSQVRLRRLTADPGIVFASAVEKIYSLFWGEGPTESILGSIYPKTNQWKVERTNRWKAENMVSCVAEIQCHLGDLLLPLPRICLKICFLMENKTTATTKKTNTTPPTPSFVSWKKRKAFFSAFPMERRQRASNKQKPSGLWT